MSSCDLYSYAVTGVQGLTPYQPGKPIATLAREIGMEPSEIIKLASNESPLGPSPEVNAAVTAALSDQARYPDGDAIVLKQRLAQQHHCKPEQITLGNGSNDVLDIVARTFLTEGCSALFSEYAFAVYPLATQGVGAEAIVVPAQRWGHDLSAMVAAVREDTRVIWIANPNNPTGTWVGRDALYTFLSEVPAEVVVVVDEAYIEFVSEVDYPDSSQWLGQFPNLIVTRTFSKAYGLAGYRVGYGLSSEPLADLLNRVRQPFNVNGLAQVAALAALDDPNHLQQGVALNRAGMMQLIHGFEHLGLEWIPSAGNFILVDMGQPALPLFDALQQRGVITRPVGNYGMPNHLRISVGLAYENRRCIQLLTQILREPR
ncbi:MAG: histidinol-phosphate transaminase [Gammaproteobacteria bacterium]|jgi:histidinol-phosphate aminotransferase|nr:histidinol-phosphate transaminase [Gammaproteobacteria bacterium]